MYIRDKNSIPPYLSTLKAVVQKNYFEVFPIFCDFIAFSPKILLFSDSGHNYEYFEENFLVPVRSRVLPDFLYLLGLSL